MGRKPSNKAAKEAVKPVVLEAQEVAALTPEETVSVVEDKEKANQAVEVPSAIPTPTKTVAKKGKASAKKSEKKNEKQIENQGAEKQADQEVTEKSVEKQTDKQVAEKKLEGKKVSDKKQPEKKEKEQDKKELTMNVCVQFQDQEYMVNDVVEAVKRTWVESGHRVSSIKEMDVYVKPEEQKAYYVINTKHKGEVYL